MECFKIKVEDSKNRNEIEYIKDYHPSDVKM